MKINAEIFYNKIQDLNILENVFLISGNEPSFIIKTKEIIMKFPDVLHVPKNVSSNNMNNFFNLIIKKLSESAKKSF